MSPRLFLIRRAALCAVSIGPFLATPSLAVSDQKCAAKFKAAQDNRTLQGQGYDEFRKIQCGGPAGTEAPSAAPRQPPTTEPSHLDTPAGRPAPTQG